MPIKFGLTGSDIGNILDDCEAPALIVDVALLDAGASDSEEFDLPDNRMTSLDAKRSNYADYGQLLAEGSSSEPDVVVCDADTRVPSSKGKAAQHHGKGPSPRAGACTGGAGLGHFKKRGVVRREEGFRISPGLSTANRLGRGRATPARFQIMSSKAYLIVSVPGDR